MSQSVTYTEVPASEVPGNLRWDTPGRSRGQMVEVSWAQPGVKDEAGPGDLWKRVTDHSDRSTWYYRRDGRA